MTSDTEPEPILLEEVEVLGELQSATLTKPHEAILEERLDSEVVSHPLVAAVSSAGEGRGRRLQAPLGP